MTRLSACHMTHWVYNEQSSVCHIGLTISSLGYHDALFTRGSLGILYHDALLTRGTGLMMKDVGKVN